MNPDDLRQIDRALALPLNESAHGVGASLLDPATITDHQRNLWQALATTAGGASIFAQPWFLSAALRANDRAGSARLLVVSNAIGQWLGVLPIVRRTSLGRMPLPHWQAWAHDNQFFGLPLICTGAERTFWDALLDLADREAGAQRIAALFLPTMPARHPATSALEAALLARGQRLTRVRQTRRAMLTGGSGKMPVLPARRAARLRALARRIDKDFGNATVEWLAADAPAGPWIDSFLHLESLGWKGERQSCLAAHDHNAALFRDVINAAHRRGVLRFARLMVDGRPAAMSTFFIDRGHGFGFKQAYDPAFCSYGPGLLLLRHITDHIVHHGEPMLFDSCSAPDQQSINRMWPERRAIADMLVPVGGGWAQTMVATMLSVRALVHHLRQQGNIVF